MNKKGFTLVELLVVIAIIGLLSTLAVVSLNSARSKAKDAKRISDIKAIQTAEEMYLSESASNPIATMTDSDLAKYINGGYPIPVDYTNYKYYICASSTSGNYLIAAKLENPAVTYPVTGLLVSYPGGSACKAYMSVGGANLYAQTTITCGTSGSNYFYCLGTK